MKKNKFLLTSLGLALPILLIPNIAASCDKKTKKKEDYSNRIEIAYQLDTNTIDAQDVELNKITFNLDNKALSKEFEIVELGFINNKASVEEINNGERSISFKIKQNNNISETIIKKLKVHPSDKEVIIDQREILKNGFSLIESEDVKVKLATLENNAVLKSYKDKVYVGSHTDGDDITLFQLKPGIILKKYTNFYGDLETAFGNKPNIILIKNEDGSFSLKFHIAKWGASDQTRRIDVHEIITAKMNFSQTSSGSSTNPETQPSDGTETGTENQPSAGTETPQPSTNPEENNNNRTSENNETEAPSPRTNDKETKTEQDYLNEIRNAAKANTLFKITPELLETINNVKNQSNKYNAKYGLTINHETLEIGRTKAEANTPLPLVFQNDEWNNDPKYLEVIKKTICNPGRIATGKGSIVLKVMETAGGWVIEFSFADLGSEYKTFSVKDSYSITVA
ncbi:hypothetical protein [[Mycoplasma] anseris]|uniref:Variable surface lipoprotein n=1 Tax=[Mycoplasma] anseris TaxID=92400 RepID=A0A2Z4NDI0_9BACT|nr:hypothetical protein [[Mycoplasma] anseris]AWX69654.1 hypothetical protein DP065_02785 [[Mycoplasma] anseris]